MTETRTLRHRETGVEVTGLLIDASADATRLYLHLPDTVRATFFHGQAWELLPPPESDIRIWHSRNTLWVKRKGERLQCIDLNAGRVTLAFSTPETLKGPSKIYDSGEVNS